MTVLASISRLKYCMNCIFHQQVMNIMHLDLKRLDLNLLLVFEAVYRLRSVTRAAAELASARRR